MRATLCEKLTIHTPLQAHDTTKNLHFPFSYYEYDENPSTNFNVFILIRFLLHQTRLTQKHIFFLWFTIYKTI